MAEPSSHVGACTNENYTGLNIMFWNARSLVDKKEELQKVIQDFDVVVIVETWLGVDVNVEFSQFITYSVPRVDKGGGGLAFIIRKSVQFSAIKDINQVDGVEIGGIKLHNLSKPLSVFAVYKPPDLSLTADGWNTVVGVTLGHENCLIMGDFNAHNEAWNCSHTNADGSLLQDKTEEYSLFLHNDDTYTRFGKTSRSNIDLIFSSLSISPHVHTEVLPDSLSSDHFPIRISVDLQKFIYRRETFKIQSKRTDWHSVNEILEEKYVGFLDFKYDLLSPTDKYAYYMEVITSAVSNATPNRKMVSAATHRNPVPWWDEDCYRAKRLRQAAFKKWEFSRREEDRIFYNKMRSEARRLFRRKKRECYRQFTSTIDIRHDLSYTWEKARLLKNKWTKVRHNKTDNMVNETKLEEALDKVCPSHVQDDPNFLPQGKENPVLDNLFTFSEFNIALWSRGDKSAAGKDGVNYEVLHNISIKYHLLLLDILNELYAADEYPDPWKVTYVHFAEKPNGKGFRPLALTSCVCKIFELMLSNRLRWWTENGQKINWTQTGFRKGFSCSDNLTIFKLDIEAAIKEKSHVLAVYLDVSNAFNEVQSDILVQKLADIDCSSKVIKFVKFLTYHREVYTEINLDSPRHCYKGVPQGGVLSPLLYLLYVTDAVKSPCPRVKILQYADDIVLYLRTDDPDTDKPILEQAVQHISGNLRDIGLEVSPDKTEVVHFNKSGVLPGETAIQVQDSLVYSTDAVKFLGIHFDYKMDFLKHQRYVIQKATSTLNIIKFLRGIHWGADPYTLICFYKSFTRSIIDYASYIYFPTQEDRILKLERIQFAAIRLAFGLRMSTPTNILLAEANLLTLRIRSELLCHNFLIKTYSKINTITRVNLDRHVRNIIFDRRLNFDILRRCIRRVVGIKHEIHEEYLASVYNQHFDIYRVPVNVDFDLGKSLRDSDYPNLIFQDTFINSEAIKIYTDGSKKKNASSVGAACVVPQLGEIHTDSLSLKASIFTAECRALSKAMDIALLHSNLDVNIYTDSYSALKAIETPKINDNTNFYLLQVLDKNRQFSLANYHMKKLTFYWIPAHTGITGNEHADSEAKRATDMSPNINQLPYTDHKAFFRNLSWTENDRRIREEGLLKGWHFFRHYEDSLPSPWYKGVNLKRELIVFITRARSCHYSLNYSLRKIKVVESPKCECGYDTQDLNHVIWQCHINQQQRNLLLKKLGTRRLFPPFDVESFLFPPNIEVLQDIYRFLCDINKRI